MKRLLGFLTPAERAVEVLFGVITTLAVTASLEVSLKGIDTRELLAAALATNTAWGFADAVFYLVLTLAERTRKRRVLDELRLAPSPEEFRKALREVTPGDLVDHLDAQTIETFRRSLAGRPARAGRGLDATDYGAALMVWLLVFCATFPVAVPFLLFDSPTSALRASQLVAIAIMFGLGVRLGRWTGTHPVKAGFCLAAVGTAVAAVCIALGA